MYDIQRMSKVFSREITKNNPYGKKILCISDEKYKNNKIKVLLQYIEDSDKERYEITNDFIENMDIDLSFFITQKINEVIQSNPIVSLSEDEATKLSWDCYKYFSAIKKSEQDKNIEIPEPPSIIVLTRLSKMLNMSINEVRMMNKRDVDSIMIMRQQENLTDIPSMIGLGNNGPGAKAIQGRSKYNIIYTGNNVYKNGDSIYLNSIDKKDFMKNKKNEGLKNDNRFVKTKRKNNENFQKT